MPRKELLKCFAMGIAWTCFLGLFGIFAFVLLWGPKVPEEEQARYCVVNLKAPGPFGLSLNCDSPEFMALSRDPRGLLAEKSVRQSRPGMALLTSILRIPFEPLAGVPALLDIKPSRSWVESALRYDFPGYVAYILVHLFLIIAAFWLFLRLSGTPVDIWTALGLASIGSLLAINDVSKAFFWSPHTTIFNITVPLIIILATMRAAHGSLTRWQWTLAAAVLIGLAIPVYAVFALMVPCIVLAGLLHTFLHRQAPFKRTLGNSMLLLVVSLVPIVAWYVFVRVKTGGFYSHELAAYNQFIWMFDAFRDGNLIQSLLRNAWQVATLAAPQAAAPAILLAVFVCLALWRRADLMLLGPLTGAALLIVAALLVFMATTGVVFARVAYALVSPFIVLAGALFVLVMEGASESRKRFLAGMCLAAAAGQLLYTLLKEGPYS
jgi:hypothetical protein